MFLEDKTLNPGTPVIADPFSLEALVAWLEKQPGETEYDYESCRRCLLAQYMDARRLSWGALGNLYVHIDNKLNHIPRHAQKIARTKPWVMSAALTRARSLLTSSKGG